MDYSLIFYELDDFNAKKQVLLVIHTGFVTKDIREESRLKIIPLAHQNTVADPKKS